MTEPQSLEGWTSVNARPPEGSAVEIMTVWTSGALLFGSAAYREGQYWHAGKMIDTPSYWRPVREPDIGSLINNNDLGGPDIYAKGFRHTADIEQRHTPTANPKDKV